MLLYSVTFRPCKCEPRYMRSTVVKRRSPWRKPCTVVTVVAVPQAERVFIKGFMTSASTTAVVPSSVDLMFADESLALHVDDVDITERLSTRQSIVANILGATVQANCGPPLSVSQPSARFHTGISCCCNTLNPHIFFYNIKMLKHGTVRLRRDETTCSPSHFRSRRLNVVVAPLVVWMSGRWRHSAARDGCRW